MDGFSSFFLGSAAWLLGDLTRAREHYSRGLEIFQRVGDLALIAWALLPLANISQESGDLDQATALYDECLPMMDDLGDRHGAGAVLMGLGMVTQLRGQSDEAHQLLVEAQSNLREGGGGQGLSWPISNVLVDTRTHDLLVDAIHRYRRGSTCRRRVGTDGVADGEVWRARSRSNSYPAPKGVNHTTGH